RRSTPAHGNRPHRPSIGRGQPPRNPAPPGRRPPFPSLAREECPAQHRYALIPDEPGPPLDPGLCAPPAQPPRPRQCALSARTPPHEPTRLVPQNTHPKDKRRRSNDYQLRESAEVSKLRGSGPFCGGSGCSGVEMAGDDPVAEDVDGGCGFWAFLR